MLRFLRKLFGRRPHGYVEYTIVVCQYRRAGLGARREEQLRWSIMVMTNELTLRGRLFQVTSSNDRWAATMRTGSSRPTWRLSIVDKTSLRSRKSLGGVRIGSIPPRQMEALDEVIRSNTPVAKHATWNSRDWVTECVALMATNGFPVDVNPCGLQAQLLPVMRQARVLTAQGGRPAIVDFYEFEASAWNVSF
ncbi:hypothetical protein VTO73DRAFT_3381 [Trametes versicolor]